jgi:hypothetical protein
MNKSELIFLVWDVPVWILNEIKYWLQDCFKAVARKIGLD